MILIFLKYTNIPFFVFCFLSYLSQKVPRDSSQSDAEEAHLTSSSTSCLWSLRLLFIFLLFFDRCFTWLTVFVLLIPSFSMQTVKIIFKDNTMSQNLKLLIFPHLHTTVTLWISNYCHDIYIYICCLSKYRFKITILQ